MSELQKHLIPVANGEHLNEQDAGRVFQIIMMGGATPAQIAAVLMGLRINGETVSEITGAAMAIRAKAKKFALPPELKSQIVDTCGTGGDAKGSYNISTAVAFVVAGAGVPVVKHGNKAVSSLSGSADVLRALGVNIEASETAMLSALKEANICFLLAPNYHQAMRHVAPVRQELGLRTIFNLLGPLSNPAFPERQLIGVYDEKWVVPMAKVLHQLGARHAWVVHGSDGMDEISTTGPSVVAELKGGKIRKFILRPEALGLELVLPEVLVGGDAIKNASMLKRVLDGDEGPYRDIVLLNAAAALVVSGKANGLKKGIEIAAESIFSGSARESLNRLVEITSLELI